MNSQRQPILLDRVNATTGYAALSQDGRLVAFSSVTSDLADRMDVFLLDRETSLIERLSVATDGTQANYTSINQDITPDGRYIVFWSGASNLVPNDTNGKYDVFVHDRVKGETSRVSISSQGREANDESTIATLSSDGRYVAFFSRANNLTPDNTRGGIFVHDRLTGETELVSLDAEGNPITSLSDFDVGGISGDGQIIAFASGQRLTDEDHNDFTDVYIREWQTGRMILISTEFRGAANAAISADGQYVTFQGCWPDAHGGDFSWMCNDIFLARIQFPNTNP
jgi:Tol biopolymer transport system component